MTLRLTPIADPLADLFHIAAPFGPWVALALLLLVFAYRLLAEAARRKTLIDICQNVPEGTEIVQEGWVGGPGMHLKIGDSLSPTEGQPSAPTPGAAGERLD